MNNFNKNDNNLNSLIEVINELVGDIKIYSNNDKINRKRSLNNINIMFGICNNFIYRLSNEIKEYEESGDLEAVSICKECLNKLNENINSILDNYKT